MTKAHYEKELKARNKATMFSVGKDPHDRVWREFDKDYALSEDSDQQAAILKKFKDKLTTAMLAGGTR